MGNVWEKAMGQCVQSRKRRSPLSCTDLAREERFDGDVTAELANYCRTPFRSQGDLRRLARRVQVGPIGGSELSGAPLLDVLESLMLRCSLLLGERADVHAKFCSLRADLVARGSELGELDVETLFEQLSVAPRTLLVLKLVSQSVVLIGLVRLLGCQMHGYMTRDRRTEDGWQICIEVVHGHVIRVRHVRRDHVVGHALDVEWAVTVVVDTDKATVLAASVALTSVHAGEPNGTLSEADSSAFNVIRSRIRTDSAAEAVASTASACPASSASASQSVLG